MTKNILFVIVFSVFTSSLITGQVLHAQWKFSTKKISNCEYDLIFTVNIDKGWHIPSVTKIKGPEGEIFSTKIIFNSSNDYILIGSLTETKPTIEYDETINKNVLLHYNKVTFTQRIKLKSASKLKISGTYEYQICNNAGCTFPPKDLFIFDLQGTSVCTK
jgi:thiol:disulfide interchange protein DsbD